jgi:hypothetical protein
VGFFAGYSMPTAVANFRFHLMRTEAIRLRRNVFREKKFNPAGCRLPT